MEKPRFGKSLRGYDVHQVDEVVRQVGEAAGRGDAVEASALADGAVFRLAFRGYEPEAVDVYLERFIDQDTRDRRAVHDKVAFTVVLRGYDCAQVDALLGRAAEAWSRGDKQRATSEAKAASFDVVLRGYDRMQVDAYLQDLAEKG